MMSRFLFLSLFCFASLVLHVQSLSSPSNFNLTTNNNSSSSSSSLPAFNITRGSSISISASNQTTSYWLSPSGIFAFGFHPLCNKCSEYQVAIWINKPSNKVVVWSLELDSAEPIYDGASIQLNDDGVFMIRQKNSNTLKPLFINIALAPASYASMEDTGNFVVYNSDMNIIWQSFSYPTDTILQGQTLKSGKSLVPNTGNSGYRLVMQTDGNLVLINDDNYDPLGIRFSIIRWKSKTGKKGGGTGIVLNLDSNGRMYLVNKDGIVIKKLTKEEEKLKNQRSTDSDSDIIYRATLESDGFFRLYGEKIRSDESIGVYCVACIRPDHRNLIAGLIIIIGYIAIGVAILLGFVLCVRCTRNRYSSS